MDRYSHILHSQRSTWDFPELKVGPKMKLAPETKLIKLKDCHWLKLVDMTCKTLDFDCFNSQELILRLLKLRSAEIGVPQHILTWQ